MLLDLRQLRSGTEHVNRTFEPSAFELTDDEFKLVAPVTLVANVRKDGQKARITGRVSTTLEVACSRCLEPYAIPVGAEFESLLLPETEAAKGKAEEEVREADLGVSVYKNDQIDLGEVMREQFYLALPMKPLCSEDCKGLCSSCGVNRNREDCTCQPVWVDPRLEPLKKLME